MQPLSEHIPKECVNVCVWPSNQMGWKTKLPGSCYGVMIHESHQLPLCLTSFFSLSTSNMALQQCFLYSVVWPGSQFHAKVLL